MTHCTVTVVANDKGRMKEVGNITKLRLCEGVFHENLGKSSRDAWLSVGRLEPPTCTECLARLAELEIAERESRRS